MDKLTKISERYPEPNKLCWLVNKRQNKAWIGCLYIADGLSVWAIAENNFDYENGKLSSYCEIDAVEVTEWCYI